MIDVHFTSLAERDKIFYLLQLDNDSTSPIIAKCLSNFSKQEWAPESNVIVYLIIINHNRMYCNFVVIVVDFRFCFNSEVVTVIYI